MTTTSLYGLNLISESQSARVPANEYLLFLEAVKNGKVLSRTTTAQPGSPADGDLYILPASPTGAAWSGNGLKYAWRLNGAWRFYAFREGDVVRVVDENRHVAYSNSAWAPFGTGGEKVWSATEQWTGQMESGSKIFCKTFTFSPIVGGINAQSHGITNLDLSKRSLLEGYMSMAGGLVVMSFPFVITSAVLGGPLVGSGGLDAAGNVFIDMMGNPIATAFAVIRAEYFRVGL